MCVYGTYICYIESLENSLVLGIIGVVLVEFQIAALEVRSALRDK